MPSNSSLPDFEKYYLPVFPEANLLKVENDLDGIKGFGKITIVHPIPEYYYFFGSLTKEHIANKAFVRTNLVMSAGLVVVNSAQVSLEAAKNELTPIDLSGIATNSLGDITKNKIIPICLDIVEAATVMTGFDFDFCPPSSEPPLVGGGNGICTKISGRLLQAGDVGFDRIVLYLEKDNIPAARGFNAEPSGRLRTISNTSSGTLSSGYFFMPMLCPDLSILYYFYPNIESTDFDVRGEIKSWLNLDKTTTISVKEFEVYPFEELHTFLTEEIDY